ncbi:hypothetical protein KP509_04G088200 [Ceratopteris richardii]|uniref:Uncharacterized protein n=1 Tax=Ceratopteris richardii TaxID=49495 RepID=A0A8T2UZ09_CERRI|nr:hypothetical protein KP509_04G088200 [Ceratopteris richardii]
MCQHGCKIAEETQTLSCHSRHQHRYRSAASDIGLAADSVAARAHLCADLLVCSRVQLRLRRVDPDFNTLISDTTTVICLDDYHALDMEDEFWDNFDDDDGGKSRDRSNFTSRKANLAL